MWLGQGIDTTGWFVQGFLYTFCYRNTDTSQIAAVSDGLKLVISLGKNVFEPDYLPFMQANEKLVKKQTYALSSL